MPESQTRPNAAKGRYIGIGVGIGIAAIIGVVLLFNANLGNSPPNGSSSIIPREHRENIVNGQITVDARSFQAYPLTAPGSANNVRVEGSFTASGGSGNDIQVMILDDQAFINWKNGHEVSAMYASGKQTTGNIDANIPSGQTVYLIYNNVFSTFSDKQVNTFVNLVYTN
jgi:hypothetical protein